MKEINSDQWALLLPEEWFAEQDEETIVISDVDEVSVIEITTFLADKNGSSEQLMDQLLQGQGFKTAIAELDAVYQEFEEDDMYWREWFCPIANGVIAISHGCDIDHKSMDDSAVDEILATLALAKDDD